MYTAEVNLEYCPGQSVEMSLSWPSHFVLPCTCGSNFSQPFSLALTPRVLALILESNRAAYTSPGLLKA